MKVWIDALPYLSAFDEWEKQVEELKKQGKGEDEYPSEPITSEIGSDAFPIRYLSLKGDDKNCELIEVSPEEALVYEVQGKFIKVGGENFDSLIGANPSAEGNEDGEGANDSAETVINVAHQKLQETSFQNVKEYAVFMKNYLSLLTTCLKNNIQREEKKRKTPQAEIERLVKAMEDRIARFRKTFLTFIVGPKFKDFTCYNSIDNADPEKSLIVLMFYKEDGEIPYFYFFKDGIIEQKF